MWQRCKAQFYYKVVQQSQWLSPQGNFVVGKEVHKLLDFQARGLEVSPFLASVQPQSVALFRCLTEHPLADVRHCIENEWAFHLPLHPSFAPHVWLTGRIDRLVWYRDQFIIVDWKTGTAIPKLPESDWQTKLYLYALGRLLPYFSQKLNRPLTYEMLAFHYVEAKPQRKHPLRVVEVPYSEAEHQAIEAELLQLAMGMLNERRYPLPSATCPDAYCPYGSICGIQPSSTEQLQLFALPQAPLLLAETPPPSPPSPPFLPTQDPFNLF